MFSPTRILIIFGSDLNHFKYLLRHYILHNAWFFSSKIVDIYDPDSGVWKVDHLSNDIVNHAVVSDGDHLLVAGGYSFQNGGEIFNVDIYKCLITGIQQIRQNEKWISVFPNPGNGTIYLSSIDNDQLGDISVSIFDVQGERLYNALLISGETELQLNLPAGAYMLRLTGSNRTQSEVIIIQ